MGTQHRPGTAGVQLKACAGLDNGTAGLAGCSLAHPVVTLCSLAHLLVSGSTLVTLYSVAHLLVTLCSLGFASGRRAVTPSGCTADGLGCWLLLASCPPS